MDKLQKFIASGATTKADLIKALEIDKLKHHVVTPRNNIGVMAHEFGHIVGQNELEPIAGQPIRNFAKAIARKGWAAVGESAGSSMPEIPVLRDIHSSIVNALGRTRIPSVGQGLIRNMLFSAPLPAAAVSGIVLSKTIRDLIKKVSPVDAIDDSVDWIADNPGKSVAMSLAPFAIHESFTSAPGGKLLHEFAKDFNAGAGSISKLAPYEATKKLIGKLGPNKEVLKFLGQNALSILGTGAVPLGMLAAHYLMNRNKES